MEGQRRRPEDIAQVIVIIFPGFLRLGHGGQGVDELAGLLHHLPVDGPTFERVRVVQLAAALQLLLLVLAGRVQERLVKSTSGLSPPVGQTERAEPCTHPAAPGWSQTLREVWPGAGRLQCGIPPEAQH